MLKFRKREKETLCDSYGNQLLGVRLLDFTLSNARQFYLSMGYGVGEQSRVIQVSMG